MRSASLPATSSFMMPASSAAMAARAHSPLQAAHSLLHRAARTYAPPAAPLPAESPRAARPNPSPAPPRSEEHTSEPQSLIRISYAVLRLKKKTLDIRRIHKQDKCKKIMNNNIRV